MTAKIGVFSVYVEILLVMKQLWCPPVDCYRDNAHSGRCACEDKLFEIYVSDKKSRHSMQRVTCLAQQETHHRRRRQQVRARKWFPVWRWIRPELHDRRQTTLPSSRLRLKQKQHSHFNSHAGHCLLCNDASYFRLLLPAARHSLKL